MRKLLLGVALFLCPLAAFGQGTYTAASCNRSDVNAVINGPTHTAINGDKIIIPAGSCSWSSAASIANVCIDITGTGTPNTGGGTTGAGTANTTIIEAGAGTNNYNQPPSSGTALFSFTGLSVANCGSTPAKVELLVMSASGAASLSILGPIQFSGSCTTTAPYCASIRADNITFTSNTWATPMEAGFVLTDGVFGVIDHNTAIENGFPTIMQNHFSAWQGVGNYGDNSFASADTFGTAQALYVENNSLSGVRGSEDDVGPAGGSQGGTRYVVRFNVFTNMSGTGIASGHGTGWLGRTRGQRQVEAYYNSASGSACNAVIGLNSGTGYYLSNSFTGVGCNNFLDLDIARFVMTAAPWGSCNGTGAYDQIPFSSTSQCVDQPGGGPGQALENATPVFVSAPGTTCTAAAPCWPNPALDPIYEAGNTTPNGAPGVNVASDGSSTRVLANRDYYAHVSQTAQTSATSPFDGTTGTGYGTLARRPMNCTAGVGYWATDQGSWNAFNSQQGTLYICQPGGTWPTSCTTTVAGQCYVPFSYPHPLETSSTMVISPASENFGSISLGTSSSPVTFTLTNNSGVTATSINPTITGGNSGDFSVVNSGAGSCAAAGGSLTTGSSCTFTVTFTPQGVGSRSSTASVAYSGGDGNSPQAASLSGTGTTTGVVTLSPSSNSFGSEIVGITSSAATFTLSNTIGIGISGISVSFTGTNASDFTRSGGTCGTTLANGASCTILVTFTPGAAGSRSGTLSVANSGPSSPNTASLSGTGINGAVTLTPSSQNFGSSPLLTPSSPITFTLTNTNATSVTGITITFVTGNPGDFSQTGGTCGSTLPGSDSCTIIVTFTPQAVGARATALNVADSDPSSPQQSSLSGTGGAAAFTSGPSAFPM